MIRSFVISAAMVAAMLGSTAALAATEGEYDNLCAMGLVLNQEVHTDCSVNETINGKTYCFGNEKARDIFMKNADKNLERAEAAYSKMKQ
ncbi:hypothetical protein V6C03_14845 [Methyloligella sp. 2.7D]|uniref:hypothetical protein n=1 Tax=unclassified Methyloligella TaxID=2625955 RepID=UPI00157D5EDC|nr:hypothetical protein [Methyloligella sp. GL2]QKP76978.1 hypothetical protein HT051_05620 [Methyloligella sp. GL2]